jgi:glycosyltransferase involved in cell wall biosynthesis
MEVTYSAGVPVRNEEKTIVQTLESILAQSVLPQKIIVCVNGSSDKTYEKVSDMASAENKINLITSAPGKANAWNRIVSESSENLVMFCDGDVVLNPEAAENMFNKFTENPKLAIVGGSNAYFTSGATTMFSRFFTENLEGKPVKQDWVCGRLYMAKLDELFNLAGKLKIDLMPQDIINEDGLLEMLTTGYREIIDSSYNLSMQVSTFNDWLVGFKRVLAGQKQLKKRYPEYYGDSDFSIKRLRNYVTRFNEISDWRKKAGVTSLFLLRTALNIYYKFSDNLDYNAVWKETGSTKVQIRDYNQASGL